MKPVDDMTMTTKRLVLVPLDVEDAEEMAVVLSDERLHEFIGGHPASVNELRDRYHRLTTGSPPPEETWLNWIARRRIDNQAVGTMQATVVDRDADRFASIAWVIGVPWQNAGFATEAARVLVTWLRSHDVGEINAHIHPDNLASAIVAARAGLTPTDEHVDGERVWISI